MNFKTGNKGITLVALVITIIILLILAGITISKLIGEGFLFNIQEAKKEYENSQIEENNILTDYEDSIEQQIVGNRDTVTISKEEYEKLKNSTKYSESEQVIGNWINGKPIYRKVIIATSPSAVNTVKHVATIDNILEIINMYGAVGNDPTQVICPINYSDSTGYSHVYMRGNGIIAMVVGNSYRTNKTTYIVVEYTKNTD